MINLKSWMAKIRIFTLRCLGIEGAHFLINRCIMTLWPIMIMTKCPEQDAKFCWKCAELKSENPSPPLEEGRGGCVFLYVLKVGRNEICSQN